MSEKDQPNDKVAVSASFPLICWAAREIIERFDTADIHLVATWQGDTTLAPQTEWGKQHIRDIHESLDDIPKLVEYIECLREWIKSEGERTNVCTKDVLLEKCANCGCDG